VTKSIFLRGCAMSAIALGSLVANPAFAAGTASGTVITNNVSVDYTVGGVNQTDATATNNITVDRKVNVTVARVDNTATSVVPGALSQAVTFRIENISNATLDFQLSTLQIATGSAAGITGTDGFDVTPALTYRLDDGDNVLDAGDTTITHLNSLAPDTPVVVHVVAASVPLGTANGSIAAVTLTATAKENDNGTAIGSNLTQAVTNTAGVDTIFADAAGVSDGVRDAAFSATDDYIVLTATLAATKTSSVVLGDYGTGAAIPGATVQYCISVSNTGGVAATGVAISDTLPSQVTYDSAYGVRVGGANCATPGAGAGSFASGVVSGTIATLATGTTQTLIFRATIN
jgi:uncharacterized repeat protein (TIGR01451 family)